MNIVSHVVAHIKSSRNIFPFTLIKEGIHPKSWNITRASNYFKLEKFTEIFKGALLC